MKFLVDAHLPKKLSTFLINVGEDSIHTKDLPAKIRTKDPEILRVCSDEKRVLISKDQDFEDSFLLKNNPAKLVLIITGNISNEALLSLFEEHWKELSSLLNLHDFIELGRTGIFVRDRR